MKPSGLHLIQGSGDAGYEVTQTFNLSKVLGVDVSGHPEVIAAFGQLAIDLIRERAKDGDPYSGGAFDSEYSEEYEESLEFLAYNKTKNVNMTLSGDMLSSMDILEADGNFLEIGWRNTPEAVRAYAHMTGYRGHPTIKGHKREFFGLTDKEITSIAKKVKPLIKAKPEKVESILDAIGILDNKNLVSFAVDELFG